MSIEIELPDLPEEGSAAEEDTAPAAIVDKKFVQPLADALFLTTQRLALTLAFFIGCCALIGWNMGRFEIINTVIEKEVLDFELQNELQTLEAEIAELDLGALSDQIADESDRVFQGFPELAAWVERLAVIARRYQIDMTFKVEQARLSAVPKILEVPVYLEFKALDQQADNLFADATFLISTVVRDHWHIDIIEAGAKGNGEQLEQISIRAQVWVRDRFGFVDPEMLVQADQAVSLEVADPSGEF